MVGDAGNVEVRRSKCEIKGEEGLTADGVDSAEAREDNFEFGTEGNEDSEGTRETVGFQRISWTA